MIPKQLDSNFLASFKRSETNYLNTNNSAMLEAYQSGIYDAVISYIGEAHLRTTGKSHTLEDVKKFLRQASFNGELVLATNKGILLKTVSEQELLVEDWFKDHQGSAYYTHLILMIPNDNDRDKLSDIAQCFFLKKLNKLNYAYVEHTDTDIYHYHVIVEKLYYDDLLSELRAGFIHTCIEYAARLI